MPATRVTDIKWADGFIRRHINLPYNSYDDSPFIEPLVLAGVFFPVGGWGCRYVSRRQLEVLAKCTGRMEFLLTDLEYGEKWPESPWLISGADFEAYQSAGPHSLAHTGIIQRDGDWAVYIAEDGFGLVGVRAERAREFWREHSEWQVEMAELLWVWRDSSDQFSTQLRRLLKRVVETRRRHGA